MTIYSYIDTLLQKWCDWNEIFMTERLEISPSDLNEILGTTGSDSGSRAKEMFRIGLLKKELSVGKDAFNDLMADKNVQSDLGFITALIFNAYSKNPNNDKIKTAYASLSAIFSIIQSESVSGKDFSINCIVLRLLDQFICPDNINCLDWIRWVVSCFYSEYENTPKKYFDYFEGKIASLPNIRILEKNSDKTIQTRFTFVTSDDIKRIIENKGSLTNIIKQKSGLFLTGGNGSNMPKGYYGIAYSYFKDFLICCKNIENKPELKPLFESLYSETDNNSKNKVIETLNKVANLNEPFNQKYTEIMKNIEEGALEALKLNHPCVKHQSLEINTNDREHLQYLTALKTKPFLLLAGISGTGKSQKVQELAFMTCPEGKLRDSNSTTPSNYQLVEVKPNWHDSTELLGYYSALSGKYELTDFIRFTYKALQNKDVPFFLCLDEMNLAPVEQYFAEYLSVLETRKRIQHKDADGNVFYTIESEPLLTKDKFSNCELFKKIPMERKGYVIDAEEEYEEIELYSDEDTMIISYLKENGLHLPENLFVIGTVNMDDTTHQFSRKVIDRAFTIEMNGGKMADMFAPASKTLLEYREKPVSLAAFKSRFVRAYEVLDDSDFSKYADIIKERIPALLGDSDGTAKDNYPESINGILNDTPFRVSYRVQNELVLYLSVLIENAEFPEDEKKIESLISEAVLAILLEKVLPRVQGEKKQLETKDGKSNILKDLKGFIEKFKSTPDENDEISSDSLYMKVIKKLEEMDSKLNGYYTNFF